MFWGYTGISPSTCLSLYPSVCISVYNILVSVKSLMWGIKSHLVTALVLICCLQISEFGRVQDLE